MIEENAPWAWTWCGLCDRPQSQPGLPAKRTARVLICLYRGHLVALHGFIKKTRATRDEDLAIGRKRQKELER